MAVSDIRLITVKCDVAVCDHEISCGADPNHARKNGWHQVSVGDIDGDGGLYNCEIKDICPECYGDLWAFLNGEDDDAKAEAINDAAEDDDETDE